VSRGLEAACGIWRRRPSWRRLSGPRACGPMRSGNGPSDGSGLALVTGGAAW